ncbi:MAG TPA: malto-oligosyltrehalose synthase, partial [Chloroflexota bacterium]|nr:malto-oligosyltrehalose synthase [Chloroflexota bacterium]
FNSLSQTLLKFASPGVADIYQGNEVWDFSLVDPDNRRPVDYKLRGHLLAEVDRRSSGDPAGFATELLKTREDGRLKMYVTYRCLAARRELPSVFVGGSYIPLRLVGSRSSHLCAFARVGPGGETAIAVAPVLLARLLRGAAEPLGEEVWGTTRLLLPRRLGTRFRDAFTGQIFEAQSAVAGLRLPLRDVLGTFPVSLLLGK